MENEILANLQGRDSRNASQHERINASGTSAMHIYRDRHWWNTSNVTFKISTSREHDRISFSGLMGTQVLNGMQATFKTQCCQHHFGKMRQYLHVHHLSSIVGSMHSSLRCTFNRGCLQTTLCLENDQLIRSVIKRTASHI